MATLKEQVAQYRDNPNIKAFLDMLAAAEGTAKIGSKSGYDVLFGGSTIDNYDAHPNIKKQFNSGKNTGTTTAAGRYQITNPTYKEFAKKLGVSDFSPQTQDDIAIAIILQSKAADDIVNGNIQNAMNKLGGRWASLPTSTHAQPKRNAEFVKKAYDTALAKYTDTPQSIWTRPLTPQDVYTTPVASTITQPPTRFGNNPNRLPVNERIFNAMGDPRLALSNEQLTPEVLNKLVSQFPNPQPGSTVAGYPDVAQDGSVVVVSSPMAGNVGRVPSAFDSAGIPESYRNIINQQVAPLQLQTENNLSEFPLVTALNEEQIYKALNSDKQDLAQTTIDPTIEKAASESAARVQNSLLNLMQQLQDAKNALPKKELFDPYPTVFDNDLLALIDTIEPNIG